MTNKGYRRVVCPACGTWNFLRPDLYRDGRAITPVPTAPGYTQVSGCWCFSSAELTELANAKGGAEYVAVRDRLRAECLARRAEQERNRPDPVGDAVKEIRARETETIQYLVTRLRKEGAIGREIDAATEIFRSFGNTVCTTVEGLRDGRR